MLVFAVQGGAMGGKTSEYRTITGTIRVIGNEPFTHLVLTEGYESGDTAKTQDYLITGDLEKELRQKYQLRKVTLEGSICKSPTPEFTHCFQPTKILRVEEK
jgi:hypothetical protein